MSKTCLRTKIYLFRVVAPTAETMPACGNNDRELPSECDPFVTMGIDCYVQDSIRFLATWNIDALRRLQPALQLYFGSGTLDQTRSLQELCDMEKSYLLGFMLQ